MEDIKKFGWHYQMPFNHVDNYAAKVQAAVIDMTDHLLVKAITEEAMAAGYTDLYLMDKTFILDAIREKLDRASEDPLTIHDLQRMNGEPVWLVWKDGRIRSRWWIVGSQDWHMMEYSDPHMINRYGAAWVAYRHKPKEAYK